MAKVPLVCQSCLFDLGLGRADARPNAAIAYAACADADRDAPAEGNAGAGIGCSVGKYRGMERAILRAVRAAKGAYGLPSDEPAPVGKLYRGQRRHRRSDPRTGCQFTGSGYG